MKHRELVNFALSALVMLNATLFFSQRTVSAEEIHGKGLEIIYGNTNHDDFECAEQCGERFISFEQLAHAEKGDLFGDGSTDIVDLIFMQKYLLGNLQLLDEQHSLADIHQDEIVNVFDLLLLKRKLIDN